MTIGLAYVLEILCIVVWGALVPMRVRLSHRMTHAITIFSAAYLLGISFINLMPHLFLHGTVTPVVGFKYAAAIPIGFFIQLILDTLTAHAEHGHTVKHYSFWGLMVGLCLHAFIEGMPLVEHDGDIHSGLLYGMLLHNIPIALIIVGYAVSQKKSMWFTFGVLLMFAMMTPMGSMFNLMVLPDSETMQTLIMGVVVGILLHVSSSILFDHNDNQLSWQKAVLILVAFTLAYFTPACSEIY